MKFIIPTLIASCFILLILISVSVSGKSHEWSETEEWSQCSAQCGDGEEKRVFECLKITQYGTKESVKPEKCSKLKMPIIKRNCNFGSCPTELSGSFIWVVGNWSQCTKICGSSAFQNREVFCFHKTKDGKLLSSKLSNCDSRIEPIRFINCAKSDCPPNFLASKWGKCPISGNCGKSVRRRNVKCVTLLKDGKHKIINNVFCFRMHLKPLPSWVVCIPDNNAICEKKGDMIQFLTQEVKIYEELAEVYQMRSSKSLRLAVGQKAFIFTFTKVTILCPVEDFPHSLLKWSHNGKMYSYMGDNKGRVRVNRKGILIISSFLLNDTGIWECHAGKSSAKVTLHHELPSNGFHNWLKRHSNHNFGMFNEESKKVFIEPDSFIWMKYSWSKCSLSCGSDDDETGFQERKVTCERVEGKYYKVIDDKFCNNDKPDSKRKCKSARFCPIWRIEEEANEECTDECIEIGLAMKNTNIYCEYETRTVDSSLCDLQKRPNSTCPNDKCKLTYQYGAWSQCSLSCSDTTNASIRSRTMHCVWDHDGQSAYHLCQKHQIPHDLITKPCNVRKCILGCRDLTPACQNQSKHRCRSSIFNNICCAFCRLQIQY